jgi:hypothetical protein
MAVIHFALGNLIILIFGYRSFRVVNLFYIIIFFLTVIILFYNLDNQFDSSVSASIFNKIFLSDDDVGSGRVEIYNDVIKIIQMKYSIIDILFGRSLGSFSDVYVINYYLQTFLEIGFIGVCFIAVFITKIFLEISRISSNIRPYFYASGLTIVLQLFSNTGFYFPHIWIYILTVYLIQKLNISK